MTGTPTGPLPAMGVCIVPYFVSRAEIMCCPSVAIPMWPSAPNPAQMHKSSVCGDDTVVAPVHVAQSITTGPCDEPLYCPALYPGMAIPRSMPTTLLTNDEQSH